MNHLDDCTDCYNIEKQLKQIEELIEQNTNRQIDIPIDNLLQSTQFLIVTHFTLYPNDNIEVILFLVTLSALHHKHNSTKLNFYDIFNQIKNREVRGGTPRELRERGHELSY